MKIPYLFIFLIVYIINNILTIRNIIEIRILKGWKMDAKYNWLSIRYEYLKNCVEDIIMVV